MRVAGSTLRLTGVTGYFNDDGTAEANPQVCDGALELVDRAESNAFVVDNGWSDSGITVFAELRGDGTLGVAVGDSLATLSTTGVKQTVSEFGSDGATVSLSGGGTAKFFRVGVDYGEPAGE